MKKLAAAREPGPPAGRAAAVPEPELDEDLLSLTEGIAQLGRFELQLAQFELELLSGRAGA